MQQELILLLNTRASSEPLWQYLSRDIVLYLLAAIRNDHFSKQLILNPGRCVTQDGGVPVSCKTSSECRLSTHLWISWQHWHLYTI